MAKRREKKVPTAFDKLVLSLAQQGKTVADYAPWMSEPLARSMIRYIRLDEYIGHLNPNEVSAEVTVTWMQLTMGDTIEVRYMFRGRERHYSATPGQLDRERRHAD